MKNYREYILALRKCADEHDNDSTSFGHVRVSDLCRATAKLLEEFKQEPCEMTTEEYRQRMIQVFQKANCSELIALCVLPTEKEFEYLKWLLKNHYKKEPCEDAVSRKAVLDNAYAYGNGLEPEGYCVNVEDIQALPPVTPTRPKGK